MKPLFDYFFPQSRDAFVPKHVILESFAGVTVEAALRDTITEEKKEAVQKAFRIFIEQHLEEGKFANFIHLVSNTGARVGLSIGQQPLWAHTNKNFIFQTQRRFIQLRRSMSG